MRLNTLPVQCPRYHDQMPEKGFYVTSPNVKPRRYPFINMFVLQTVQNHVRDSILFFGGVCMAMCTE